MTSKASNSPASCSHTSSGRPSLEDMTFLQGEADKTIKVQGEVLGMGVTGLVERLKSGDVIKSPWIGVPNAATCRNDMAIEARVYERLGSHPRLVQVKNWDSANHILTLEYMPNGSLKEYIEKHRQEILRSQREQWVKEAAEAVDLLHSHHVIQSDVGPHNFLLDGDLGLKICDFGGASVDGSRPEVLPGARYRLPGLFTKDPKEKALKGDLFGLGSTIFFIATGHEPYEELTDDDQIEKLYQDGRFPVLSEVLFAEIIALCWKQEAESAKMVLERVMHSLSTP
ncbi:kinase-like protein [Pseudovirgaria hyperparasitica]|uniref:Kinase-like protein n=1 Tax=Pseudovirgaria hyperparasitica TaxID=470096 RepID=A0A6A6VYF5_9PEZI|nr:kinase-like protein [Pseudovirgaria hyperparasitica]KAF2754754.1 kinase-like protein [Pseudovirgaria hyperparasitica]